MSDLDVIKEIEKRIRRKLKPCPSDADIMDFGSKCCYLLDNTCQVTGLNLVGCKIERVDFLNGLKNISYLNLSDNEINENKLLSVLRKLHNIKELSLRNNNLTEINYLFDYIRNNLEKIFLESNEYEEIIEMEKFKNLTMLDLAENNLEDVSNLECLTNLHYLNLSKNKITDINFVKELRLKKLDISDNYITKLPGWIENKCLEVIHGSKNTTIHQTQINKNGNNIININSNNTLTEIKTMTGESRTINAQNYVEGNNNGNMAGRDINIQNNQGMSKEEFLKLLQALKEDLPNSGLSAETIDDANQSLEAIEKQVASDKPNQSTVKRKLEYIDDILEDANQTMETVEKGKEVFEKVVDTVKILVSAIATASFLL